jgi:hypothetical protein
MAYFINPSHQSVSMCIPSAVAGQRLGIHVSAATNTRNKKELLDASFSMWSVTYQRSLSLQGNGSVNTFPPQRRIVGVVFYAVRVVSKESRRSVLPRTCFKIRKVG